MNLEYLYQHNILFFINLSQRRKEYEREKGRIEKPEMNAGVSVNSGEKMNDEGREIIIAMITKQLKGRRGRGGGAHMLLSSSPSAPFLLFLKLVSMQLMPRESNRQY